MTKEKLYDYYIEDYLIHHFRDLKACNAHRDQELEGILIFLGSIETRLQSKITPQNLIVFKDVYGELPDGLKYEITFIDDKFKAVVLSNYKPFNPTFSDLFDLKVADFIKFPLLILFCTISALTHKGCIKFLQDELDNVEYKDPSPSIPLALKEYHVFSRMMEYRKGLYHYFNKECMLTGSYIYVEYLDDRKVVIPAYKNFITNHHHIYCSEIISYQLFNLHLIDKFPHAVVILTDSLELACINQTQTYEINESVIWLSWYGDIHAVKKIDWSPLKGRRIYYLLKEHSGFGGQTVYNTALLVEKVLRKVKVKEFKFVSYLSNGIHAEEPATSSTDIPVTYEVNEIESELARKKEKSPRTFDDFKNLYFDRKKAERNMLMSPFIMDQSISIIAGESQKITFFTTYLSYFLSRNLVAVENWDTIMFADVDFIHIEYENWNSLSYELEIVKKIAYGIKCQKRIIKHFKEYYASSDSFQKICNNITKKKSDPPRLIVINGLAVNDKSTITRVNNLLRNLVKERWTVILGVDTGKSNKNFIKKLMYDSCMFIKEKTLKSNFNLKIDSCFKGPTKLEFILNQSSTTPTFTKFKKNFKRTFFSQEQREKIKSQIIKLLKENVPATEIIKRITPKIKLSMYKKLKSELVREEKIKKRRYNKRKFSNTNRNLH